MKVALTVWGQEISPVFDSAQRLLVAELEYGSILTRHHVNIGSERIAPRIAMLSDMNVQVLVCGAISEPVANMIKAGGIRIIPYVTGNTETVLDAFMKGLLASPCFQMPGYRQGRRRRRGSRQVIGVSAVDLPIACKTPEGNGTCQD